MPNAYLVPWGGTGRGTGEHRGWPTCCIVLWEPRKEEQRVGKPDARFLDQLCCQQNVVIHNHGGAPVGHGFPPAGQLTRTLK